MSSLDLSHVWMFWSRLNAKFGQSVVGGKILLEFLSNQNNFETSILAISCSYHSSYRNEGKSSY